MQRNLKRGIFPLLFFDFFIKRIYTRTRTRTRIFLKGKERENLKSFKKSPIIFIEKLRRRQQEK